MPGAPRTRSLACEVSWASDGAMAVIVIKKRKTGEAEKV